MSEDRRYKPTEYAVTGVIISTVERRRGRATESGGHLTYKICMPGGIAPSVCKSVHSV